MRTRKDLTLEERRFIEIELSRKSFCHLIAVKLGRSHSCIFREIQKNGGESKYNAETAQEKTELSRKRGREKGARVQRRPFISRIESLEMQIKILSETVKELVNASRNK